MGKHKYIETPEKLYELWQECKNEIDNNPIKVHDYVGKDAEEVYRLRQRPYTYEAFKVFCKRIGLTINHYFENSENAYNDYRDICRAIKDEIRLNQIEGGMVGIYNPSITQRLNGLVEKTETKTEVSGVEQIVIKRKSDD
jgi:DNA polymerase II small subunit/DNA polymerase delta subunit B